MKRGDKRNAPFGRNQMWDSIGRPKWDQIGPT